MASVVILPIDHHSRYSTSKHTTSDTRSCPFRSYSTLADAFLTLFFLISPPTSIRFLFSVLVPPRRCRALSLLVLSISFLYYLGFPLFSSSKFHSNHRIVTDITNTEPNSSQLQPISSNLKRPQIHFEPALRHIKPSNLLQLILEQVNLAHPFNRPPRLDSTSSASTE